MGPAAEPALVRDCAGSVISQCASYQNARAVVQRLAHLDVHDPATIEHLADHVYRFSLGGIRALAKAGKAGEPGKGTRVRQEVGQRKG